MPPIWLTDLYETISYKDYKAISYKDMRLQDSTEFPSLYPQITVEEEEQ